VGSRLRAQGKDIMTHIRLTIAAFVAAGLICGTTVAADQATRAPGPTRGSAVTLTSCVEKAQNDEGDKFVLTHLADVPDYPETHGRVVYWVDDVTKIRPHVGRQIRLIGTITDIDKAEMEVKLGAGEQGGAVVEIEGHGTQVKTSPRNADISTRDQKVRERDIATTVVKLRVDRVDMVAATCKLAQ
jgi:hypothetical protein